ncbi:MAG: hypothetical protein N2380_08850 [bacterium]|nr:hypothetical protein [bacterium]
MKRILFIFLILLLLPFNVKAESLVNNVFVDTDIRQALRDISNQTGIIIVVDNTVEGFVSADLKDVPLEKALEILLSHYGYVYAKKEGYYLVGSPDVKNATFNSLSKTIFYRPKYLSVDAMKQKINDTFSQFIKVDSSLNVISITAPDSMIGNIVNKIREIDRPVRLVYVDVLYTKASYNEIDKLLPTQAKVEWKLDGESSTGNTGIYFTDLKLGYFYSDSTNVDVITEILKSKGNIIQSARSKFLVLEGEKSSILLEEKTYRTFSIENYTTTVSFSANIEMGVLAEVIDDKVRLNLDLLASYIDGALKKSLGSTKAVVSLDPNRVAILGGITGYRELSEKFGAFKPYISSNETSKDSFTVFLYAREVPEELTRGVLPVLETNIYTLTKLPDKKGEGSKGLTISGGSTTVIDVSTSNLANSTIRSGLIINGSVPISDKNTFTLEGIYIQEGLKSLSLSLNHQLIPDIIAGISYRLARNEKLSVDALGIFVENETYPFLYLTLKGKLFGLLMNDNIKGQSYTDVGINLSVDYKITDYTTLTLEYFRTSNVNLLSSARVELTFELKGSLFFTIGYDHRDSKYLDNIISPSYARWLYLRLDYKL